MSSTVHATTKKLHTVYMNGLWATEKTGNYLLFNWKLLIPAFCYGTASVRHSLCKVSNMRFLLSLLHLSAPFAFWFLYIFSKGAKQLCWMVTLVCSYIGSVVMCKQDNPSLADNTLTSSLGWVIVFFGVFFFLREVCCVLWR